MGLLTQAQIDYNSSVKKKKRENASERTLKPHGEDRRCVETIKAGIAKLKSMRDQPLKENPIRVKIVPPWLFDKMVEEGVIDKEGNEL